ncbi:MAG: SusC/RagA family TonB-linked outer membrane protein [Bacteroidota bacterium]
MKIHLPAPLQLVRAVLLSIIVIGPQLFNSANARPNGSMFASYQQSTTVSGKVTSATDNEGIPGVNIVIKGTSNGTVTDVNGDYKLEVNSRDAILVFTSIGFDTQEFAAGGQTVINVTLQASTTSLSEVVVVGYGTQQKMSITNSIADIKGDEMVQRPVGNILQSVQGKMPGVTILDRGGQPGSNNMQIIIRGVTKPYTPVGLDQTVNSTIGTNQPLFIVDGIEQPYQYMNPADIESFTVLKDASSSAIYGSRGGNGVVLITTKRAKEGKISVSYSGSYSTQKSLTQPHAMDIENYLRLQNTAYQNVGSAPKYTEQQIQDYISGSVNSPLKYPLPYDWYNVMLKDAPQINNSISVAGGSENMKARLSVRNQDQKGIIANTESKLTDIRLNTDLKLSSKITISGDLNYRYQKNQEPHDITNIFRLFMQNAIWAVPQYPNGDYGGGTQGNSPLLLAEKGGSNKTQNDYFYGQLKGNWEIVKGLTLTSQVGVRNQFLTGKDYTNTWQTKDSTVVKKSNLVNSLTESRTVDREVTWNNLLNYNLELTNHSFRAMAGYAQIYHFNTTISAYRQQFYNNDVQSLGQGVNDATKNNGGSDYTWGLRSYFGRLNYAFKDKYLFEANLRYDGSSRFDKGNKYASFPSASVGYRISQEAFWNPIADVVSDLKIRASRGVSGNNGVDLYSYIPTLQAANYSFNGTVAQGYLQKTVNDPNLTWERTAQTDIGIDGELFRDVSALQ